MGRRLDGDSKIAKMKMKQHEDREGYITGRLGLEVGRVYDNWNAKCITRAWLNMRYEWASAADPKHLWFWPLISCSPILGGLSVALHISASSLDSDVYISSFQIAAYSCQPYSVNDRGIDITFHVNENNGSIYCSSTQFHLH